MKITFSNLGAIKKTTLDLRPLTVIIGPNNSNKTYIAYSIYGLWQSIYQQPSDIFFDADIVDTSDKKFSLKITNRFIDSFIKDCEEKLDKFNSELETFFQDSSKQIFNNTKYKISISRKEVKDAIEKLSGSEFEIFYNSFKFKLLNNDVLQGEAIINDDESEPIEASETEFAFTLMWSLRRILFGKPFPFPAERNAFIINYKLFENRRFKLLKKASRQAVREARFREPALSFFGNDVQLSNTQYPQPIEDFLDFLNDLELIEWEELDEFSKIADFIEESIQGQNKTKFTSTESKTVEIRVNIKKGLDIDLYNASSSIKQLAPLILYLRYRAQEGDLLIIDEPEMNLHPESQAKLLEVLGMLVNAGVNVLLTTHSPYFMSHLNNLIAGNMTEEKTKEKQAKSLYLEDARAFLKPEDVGAYEMRQNKKGEQTLHNLYDEDYGIRWDTLSDVSGVIQQKYFEIYEKGKNSSDGEEES